MTRDKISAFVDGELQGHEVEMALSILRLEHGRDRWDAYHQIGDALRSDELAFNMSDDFSVRLTARLEREPTILASVAAIIPIAPKSGLAQTEKQLAANDARVSGILGQLSFKKMAIVSAAAAAVTAALVAAPPLMVASNGYKDGGLPPIASSSVVRLADPYVQIPVSTNRPSSFDLTKSSAFMITDRNGVMLRDPRIDDYLAAHQRFSPSVYSTAQYARSAAFVSATGH